MLTDAATKNAKPADKPRKLADEKGLYLLIAPTGGKLWRLKYHFDGKEKLLSLGAYPDVSLSQARERRDEARKLLANGADPGAARKAQKAAKLERVANSFEVVAREWFERWKTDKAESHSSKVIARLEKDVFPWLGGTPVASVTAPMVLSVLRRIEGRGVIDTAHRAKEAISQVMRYAIATGRAERDPCPDLRGALQTLTHSHMAAITDPIEVGRLLRVMDAFKGIYTVRAALRLAPIRGFSFLPSFLVSTQAYRFGDTGLLWSYQALFSIVMICLFRGAVSTSWRVSAARASMATQSRLAIRSW
jgi:hypothetical protein